MYLEHHGILGQRWGIRRYQNEDGTLTEAGKKRYDSSYTYTSKNGDKVNILVSKEKNYSDGTKETEHTAYVNGKKTVIMYLDSFGKESNINWISTKKSKQGKGYAQAMMNHAIKYSKNKGYDYITLEVPDGDDNAKHIYTKYGFNENGRIDDSSLTKMKRKL